MSSSLSSWSLSLEGTPQDFLVVVAKGINIQPIASQVREGFDAFKRILSSSGGLPISQDWFTVNAKVTETRGWANPTNEYRDWFNCLHVSKKYTWNRWRLYDMISLSPSYVDHDFNAFLFPWGMVTPTFLDFSAITGFPAHGQSIHLAKLPKKVNLSHAHVGGVYSKLLAKNSKSSREITEEENTMFVMYFFYHFFYGTAFAGIVQEL